MIGTVERPYQMAYTNSQMFFLGPARDTYPLLPNAASLAEP